MGELSALQVYLVCVAISIIAAWVIQIIDGSDDGYGFSYLVFFLGLIPYLNIALVAATLTFSGIALLFVIASLPRIIRACRK